MRVRSQPESPAKSPPRIPGKVLDSHMPDEQTDPLRSPLLGLKGKTPVGPPWFERNIALPGEHLSVEVAGSHVEARAWGVRGRPGLIFLHGSGAHLGWWSFLAPFFAETHRVVALSFGGAGASTWRDRYSIQMFVREMWSAADAAGISSDPPQAPILVGHSMGGLPVIAAMAEAHRPVRSGVLVDTALPDEDMKFVAPGQRSRPFPNLAAGLARFRLSPPQPCENLWILDFLGRRALRETESGEFTWRSDPKLTNSIEFGDVWAQISAARAPFVVLRGELSEITSGPRDRRMRSVAPRGTRFMEIPLAYHHVMVDQPLALVAALRAIFTL